MAAVRIGASLLQERWRDEVSPRQEERADATGEKLGLWRLDRALEVCSGAGKPTLELLKLLKKGGRIIREE